MLVKHFKASVITQLNFCTILYRPLYTSRE